MKKLVLIMPARASGNLPGKPWLPPGSLLEVAAMTPPGWTVELYDELARGALTADSLPSADFYGIGGLSTSHHGARRVTELIHAQGKKVVAGGMDVTGNYAEANATALAHFDSIVAGRLTPTLWADVLAGFTANSLAAVYQARDEEPWQFVVPRHDMINPRDYFFPATVRSSAGCTEACSFCTVYLVAGRRRVLYTKPAKILDRELALIAEVFPGTHLLIDCSDSFGADLGHTLKVVLPRYRDLGWTWLTEITIKNLVGTKERPGLIAAMAAAGCGGVYIGIENPFERVSGKSLSTAATEDAIRRTHDAGMLVLGSILLDVTGRETKASIRRTVEWVIAQKLDFVQLSLTALLPGSADRQTALKAGWPIDDNPEHYDGAWPTNLHHPLSAEDRIHALQWGYREIYSWRRLIDKLWQRKLWRIALRNPRLVLDALRAFCQIHRSAAAWEDRVTQAQSATS